MRAYINVSAVGLVARTGELDNTEYWSQDDLNSVVAEHRDFVIGLKVRMGHPRHGIKPLLRALEAGSRLGLPVMVHVRNGPPTIQEVLKVLRKGDILTYCYTAADMALAGEDGRWIEDAHEERGRGVIFDLGHGGASFGWKSAEHGFVAGFQPDVISSDLHQCNYCEPNVDLPQSMSKMLHLGMSLPDVIQAVTSTPAAVAGMVDQAGSLKIGSIADISVFDLEAGSFTMGDTVGETRTVERRFRHVLTIAGGNPLPLFSTDPRHISVSSPR